ncbi:hypothetical protein BGZ70_006811 [Mortierella alpina]|uniref:GH16 domain-containing protein n=1 Tax=Mortierella alpina TaxID=64518 RepID=A0A9P6M3Q1_MORAP|nr:hypothetical protein BGZ70_006811 [Mortierella alpina]
MIVLSRIHITLYLCLLSLLITLFTATEVDAKGCQHYKDGNSNCPEEAPCCKSGWCSNAESFCALALGCQPENSFNDNTCLPTPQCTSFTENFDGPESVLAMANFSGNPMDAAWTSDFLPNHARVENGELILTARRGHSINKFGKTPGFGATVSSTRWIHYGKVTAKVKSGSPSGGIVSSFIFRSFMTGDEIDFEWVGKQPNEVQSNYYWHTPATMDPKDIDYSHSRRKDLGMDLSQEYQTYTIEWLPDSLTWFINGEAVRTLLRSEVNGTQYPSSPSQIQFSIWDGGVGEEETREWAGGPTDWETRESYEMFVDWVEVECLSPVDPKTTPWPPKDQGFQGFVNPLERDPSSPLAKEALVLGENAPTFSTLNDGGLHWGRYGGGGRNLIGGKYPIPSWANDASRSRPPFGSWMYTLKAWMSGSVMMALLYTLV